MRLSHDNSDMRTHTCTQTFFKSQQLTDNVAQIRSMRKAELQPAPVSDNTVESDERWKSDTLERYALTFFPPPPLQWHLIYVEMKCLFECYWQCRSLLHHTKLALFAFRSSALPIMYYLYRWCFSALLAKYKVLLTQIVNHVYLLYATFEPGTFPVGIQHIQRSPRSSTASPPASSPSPVSKLGQLNRVGAEHFAGVVEMRDKDWSQTGGRRGRASMPIPQVASESCRGARSLPC